MCVCVCVCVCKWERRIKTDTKDGMVRRFGSISSWCWYFSVSILIPLRKPKSKTLSFLNNWVQTGLEASCIRSHSLAVIKYFLLLFFLKMWLSSHEYWHLWKVHLIPASPTHFGTVLTFYTVHLHLLLFLQTFS